MGPSQCSGVAANGFTGPIIFLGAAANALGWAHPNAQMQQSMALLRPMIFLETAADVLGCACFNIQAKLSIALLEPIIILGVTANAL